MTPEDIDYLKQHATAYAKSQASRHDIPPEYCAEYGEWYVDHIAQAAELDNPDHWPAHPDVFPEWLKIAPLEYWSMMNPDKPGYTARFGDDHFLFDGSMAGLVRAATVAGATIGDRIRADFNGWREFEIVSDAAAIRIS